MQHEALVSRLSAAQLGHKEREPLVREEIWRPICHLDIQPIDAGALDFEFNLLSLVGLHYQESYMSGAHLKRDGALAARAQDKLAMVTYFDGPTQIRWRGRELEASPGEVFLLHTSELARVQVPDSRYVCIGAHPDALEPLLGNGGLPGMTVLGNSAAFRLLLSYVRQLMDNPEGLGSPELQQLALRHVHELMAAVIGMAGARSGDTEQFDSSLRTARLRAIKTIIHRHLGERDLSLPAVAAEVGVTTRYVQQLFEREGTSFTRYVLEQRLARAYQVLGNPAYQRLSITRIALDAGFGDISYFNRRFRQRYGATPSDIRATALC